MLDPIERAASAQTLIRGSQFFILLRADLDQTELSISLYHEVLEAATVSALYPPESVCDLNEGVFERIAREYHGRLGVVSENKLNQMLAEFGF